ncbi:putative N-acetyltransferase YhbS [Phyllobacterium bourgognense]|uniref:Putative N-acetyltransferase YhbS n=2 Tax=Phyllobacterium bourgognense TaxID=314236 RepID=A0A368YSJ3_9HYPH|nr:putative N-acetyltransferase YhbS [Phyllobacterium bourgognense]
MATTERLRRLSTPFKKKISSMLTHVVTYAPEEPVHDAAIEDINKEAFGPGRFTRAAYRIREGGAHDRALSFVALNGEHVVGSVRLTPIQIGATSALLLGPLAVRPAWKNQGIGAALMRASMEEARVAGHHLVILVGDESYYAPFGFRQISGHQIEMPAPVDPARFLACELKPRSLENVQGRVRHAAASQD